MMFILKITLFLYLKMKTALILLCVQFAFSEKFVIRDISCLRVAKNFQNFEKNEAAGYNELVKYLSSWNQSEYGLLTLSNSEDYEYYEYDEDYEYDYESMGHFFNVQETEGVEDNVIVTTFEDWSENINFSIRSNETKNFTDEPRELYVRPTTAGGKSSYHLFFLANDLQVGVVQLTEEEVEGWFSYEVNNAVVVAVSPAAVSVFSVSLDLVDDEEWVVCGSSHCRSCDNAWCQGEFSGLGTDGKNQVQECPEDFYEIEFITVDRYWPFRDQYLRLCANFYYDDDEDYYYDEK